MITLNQTDSALLLSALDAEQTLMKWLHDTPAINNATYSTIRDNFIAWDTANTADGGIIITKPNNTTEEKTGIDQVPIPPVRG